MEEDFQSGAAGASLTYPMEAGQIRKGGYIVINERPCKVVNVSTSKTGKHGHAKAKITALDVFTGNKGECVVPTSHNVDVPNVSRCELTLVDLPEPEDGQTYPSLMDEEGNCREDLALDASSELYTQILAETQNPAAPTIIVSAMKAMGEEKIIAVRTVQE
jgi:translation initiation factor 5A